MPKFSAWIATALALAGTPALAAGFEAGQWRHQTRVISAEVPGVSEGLIKLVAGTGRRTSCHSARALQANPESLMTGDPTATCRLRNFSMANGRLVYDTFCTNRRFPDGLRVLSRGSYTAQSYEISTVSTGVREGKPVRIETTGSGRRVAACTAR